MANNDGTGEKTEQATPKKIRDARREGQVAKSRDLSQTATLLIWTALLAGFAAYYADQLAYLATQSWAHVSVDDPEDLLALGNSALEVLLKLSVLPLVVVGLFGVLIELLQVGPLFAAKRIAPQPKRLNPSEGLKRMFSMQNLLEVVKAIAKTVVLVVLTALLLKHYLPDVLTLPKVEPAVSGLLQKRILLMLMAWISLLFAFFSLLDWLLQKWQHAKNLRMSKADVRREHKDDQGDPQIRGQRRSLHQQWANQNALDATRNATALLVNPTHIAIAISYIPDETAAPLVTAKAEGHLAALMRQEAEAFGVPIVRNVALARALNFQADEDDTIPEAFFAAVADIVLWAEEWRAARAAQPSRAVEAALPNS